MSSAPRDGRQQQLGALARLAGGDRGSDLPSPWRRIWWLIQDPVEPQRPGEAEGRVARIVDSYRSERDRVNQPGALPRGWRWASASALAVGLLLGVWTSSRIGVADAPAGELEAGGREALLEQAWAAAAPLSLAEVYLSDLGFDAAGELANGDEQSSESKSARVVR